MGPEAQALLTGVLVAVVILDKLVPMVLKKLHSHRNGSSGERPVEYWLMAFREIVRDEIRMAFEERRWRDERRRDDH